MILLVVGDTSDTRSFLSYTLCFSMALQLIHIQDSQNRRDAINLQPSSMRFSNIQLCFSSPFRPDDVKLPQSSTVTLLILYGF